MAQGRGGSLEAVDDLSIGSIKTLMLCWEAGVGAVLLLASRLILVVS